MSVCCCCNSCCCCSSEGICCRRKYTDDERQHYNDVLRLSQFELIESSLPVFISSGISYCMVEIIKIIAHQHLYTETIIYAVYTCIIYGIFKFICYKLLKSYRIQSTSIIIQYINKYKLNKIISRCLVEITAFAWKDGFINIIFSIVYYNYNILISYIFWIILVFIAIMMINITNLICKYYLPTSRKHLYLRLLSFDIESFSFPIAYLVTVLLMLSIEPYSIASDSYLYSWKEGYSYDSEPGGLISSVYVAYTSVIMLIASVTQFDLTSHNNHNNNNNNNHNNNCKDRHDDKYDDGCNISSNSANDDSISHNGDGDGDVTHNVIIKSSHLNIDGTHVQQQHDHHQHHHQQQQQDHHQGHQRQEDSHIITSHGDGSESKSDRLVSYDFVMIITKDIQMQ